MTPVQILLFEEKNPKLFQVKNNLPKPYKLNSLDKNKEVQMHLYCIIEGLVYLLSTVIFPKTTFTKRQIFNITQKQQSLFKAVL